MESPTYIVIILIQEKEISIKRSTETAKRKGKTSYKQWLTEFGLIISLNKDWMTHTWSLCERPSLPSLLSRPKTVEEFVKPEENIDIRKVKNLYAVHK